MSTLFISDLHLDSTQPDITHTFFYFLDHIARGADALYILGDFFENYIGDDNDDPFIQTIIRALARFTATGTPVFFMPGNRDFLLGQSFADRAGITLIPDPTVITLYGQTILLMHGDQLCTDDKNHQRFRRFSRNRFVQTLFLSLPLSYRKKCADQLRKKSMQYNQRKSAEIMDVNQGAVTAALKKYGTKKLIHGHTHRPLITENRVVLDAWHTHGNYLKIEADGHVAFTIIPSP